MSKIIDKVIGEAIEPWSL